MQVCMVSFRFSTRSWGSRKSLLDQCHALQNFNHEAEQAESWMAKREAFLSSEDVGSSLDAVEALIKKHEDFDKSLQTQVRILYQQNCMQVPHTKLL